jgi:hypothetical protein
LADQPRHLSVTVGIAPRSKLVVVGQTDSAPTQILLPTGSGLDSSNVSLLRQFRRFQV